MPCHPLCARLVEIHHALSGLGALSPGPVVNRLFGQLVELSAWPADAAALRCPRVAAVASSLRRLCAEGESELELDWARRLADAADPSALLHRFPYYAHYRRLVRLEAHALLGLGYSPPRTAAFIGSGPLPLSPILFAELLDARVDGVERDAEAHGLAVKVTERLGLAGSLRFRHEDALDLGCLRSFDLVVLAALVGEEQEGKRRVLRHLARRMRPGAVLLARTAWQLRALLYPAIRLEDLEPLVPKLVLHPLNEVINSVIVAECVS